MLLWMALVKGLPRQTDQFAAFHRDGLTGMECNHKVRLAAGVGNIGQEAAKIGKGSGMRVIGVDIQERHADVCYVSIAEGIAQADVIVCAMNLTPRNLRLLQLWIAQEEQARRNLCEYCPRRTGARRRSASACG